MSTLPTEVQVGEALVKQLFYGPTAGIAISFGTNLAPNYFELSSRTTARLSATVDSNVLADLIAAGKRVAEAAAAAILEEAKKHFQNVDGQSKMSAAAVGRFASEAQNAIPILTQLSSAAIPEIYVNGNPETMNLFRATLQQVTNTTSSNFINQAQHYINSSDPTSAPGSSGWLDTLKDIGKTVASAAAGIIPVIAPIILQKIQGAAALQKASADSTADGNVANSVSNSAVNATTRTALLKTYATDSHDVGLRGTQAIIAVAKELHDQYTKANSLTAVDPAWWDAFVKASQRAGGILGTFSPSLLLNSNTSLQDIVSVQQTSLSSAITTGAYTAQQLYPVDSFTGDVVQDGIILRGFFDTLAGIAAKVAPVISTIVPIAAQLASVFL